MTPAIRNRAASAMREAQQGWERHSRAAARSARAPGCCGGSDSKLPGAMSLV